MKTTLPLRAILLLAALAALSLARAADVTATWTNATSGIWDANANWTNAPVLGGFPNNGNGGVATYDAVINAVGANYTVTLGTNITIEDLTLSSANATVNHTAGTFTATGAITLSAGTYQLSGGTISGTVINVAGGSFVFTSSGGDLSNGAVFNGNLNLSASSASLRLLSGASFTGVANLSGSNARLAIQDTQTLTGKTLNLDGSGAKLTLEGANTLTLGAGTLLRGRGTIGGQELVGGTNALINQAGTIRADLAGQTLTISSNASGSFTNQAGGITEAINGSTLNIGATSWSNVGQINATGGSTLNFNGTWSNAGGTASVDATSTLNLGGASTTGNLGTINNSAGGTVNITGTITNTATNLAFNATTGSWQLAGGTISGGQITPGGGGQTLLFTSSGGDFSNGAVFNGDINLSASSASLRLLSGAGFSGVANLSGSNARLAIQDTQTLTGKTLNLDGSGARLTLEGANTLTLGAGTLLRGRGTIGGQEIVGGTNALINQAGTIRADLAGQTLTISSNASGSFTNQAGGITEAINGSTLTIGAANWSNVGQINATGGSTVNFNGTWSNAAGTTSVGATSTLNLGGASTVGNLGTINNSAGGTVNVTGTITNTATNLAFNATTGSWQLAGGTISGGQITPGGGGQTLLFTSSGGDLSNGAVFNGNINLSASSASLRLLSGAGFTGVANVSGSNARLAIQDTRTLTGKTINLDGSGVRLTLEAANTLTLGAGTLLRGRGTIGGQELVGGTNAIINQAGTIRADLAGQTLTISSGGGGSFANQAAGVTEAINGSTLAISATSWSNAGQINATGGSTLNFNGTWSNAGGTATVDATSTLNLGGASTVGNLGTINNSAGGTVNITGTIDNTATNLAFNATTGSWRLFGGAISGGQITPGGGGQTLLFTSSGGDFSNGAVFNGDLNLSTNSASLRLLSGAGFTGVANLSGTGVRLAIQDTRTLTGKTLNLDGSGARLTIEGTNTLTLGAGTLLRGRGTIGGQDLVGGTNALINQGTIRADLAGQTLTISSSSFNNAGTFEAINGGTLTRPGGYAQTAGVTRVSGGTITAQTGGVNNLIQINGGSLEGNGTIVANVFAAGIVDPTLGVGGLVINGDLSLGTDVEFRFAIGGTTKGTEYDFLSEAGTVPLTLDGTLTLSLTGGFTPAFNDVFTILTSNQTLAGAFDNIASGMRLTTTDGMSNFIVTYNGQSVVLSAFQVPEPSSLALLAFGALVFAGRRARKHRGDS